MNIKNDTNDITIDYYTVENFNDINSQAPSCLMDSRIPPLNLATMFHCRFHIHNKTRLLLITAEMNGWALKRHWLTKNSIARGWIEGWAELMLFV